MTHEPIQKRIALIAHDNKKDELLEWVKDYKEILTHMELFATGTTGRLLQDKLELRVNKLQSGPLGGDLQIGAMIAENQIDILIFFWDPLEAQPHDPDVKAILRLAVVWNIPVANNRASADYLFTSRYIYEDYKRELPSYANYRNRDIQV